MFGITLRKIVRQVVQAETGRCGRQAKFRDGTSGITIWEEQVEFGKKWPGFELQVKVLN